MGAVEVRQQDDTLPPVGIGPRNGDGVADLGLVAFPRASDEMAEFVENEEQIVKALRAQ